jgi:hypothetical protein
MGAIQLGRKFCEIPWSSPFQITLEITLFFVLRLDRQHGTMRQERSCRIYSSGKITAVAEEDPFLILQYDSEVLSKLVRHYSVDVHCLHDARKHRCEQAERSAIHVPQQLSLLQVLAYLILLIIPSSRRFQLMQGCGVDQANPECQAQFQGDLWI